MRRAAWSSRYFALLSMLLAPACGDDGGPTSISTDASASEVGLDAAASPLDAGARARSDAGEGCRTFVSDSLIQHACFHELMGPYAERTAGASSAAGGIDVDRAHTSFRVKLTERPEGGFGGVLRYQARFAGAYALFSRDATVRVDLRGAPQPTAFAHATDVCAVLPMVAAYDFAAETYTLDVASDRADVVIVIEYMDEGTVADAYRFECGSGPRTSRDASVFVLDAGAVDGSASLQDGTTATPDDAAGPAVGNDASASTDSDADSGQDAARCQVDPVLEHSCLHAMHGPFEPLSASADLAAAPDISRPHIAWLLNMPTAAAGRLRYRATMTGEYVFYLDKPFSLELRSEGMVIAPTYAEPVASCAGIAEARVYPLSSGARYDLAVGPAADDKATLIVESVVALTARGWADRLESCQ